MTKRAIEIVQINPGLDIVGQPHVITIHKGVPTVITFRGIGGQVGKYLFALLAGFGNAPAGTIFADNFDGTSSVTGTATAYGDFPITLHLENNGRAIKKSFIIRVPELTLQFVQTAPVYAGIATTPGQLRLVANGGSGTGYTYSMPAYPTAIDPATGYIDTTTFNALGTYGPIAGDVTDSAGNSATVNFAIIVVTSVVLDDEHNLGIPIPDHGWPYYFQFRAIDVTGAPITWSYTGTLPAGMALDPGTGELTSNSVTEAAPGTGATYTIIATSTTGNSASMVLTDLVSQGPLPMTDAIPSATLIVGTPSQIILGGYGVYPLIEKTKIGFQGTISAPIRVQATSGFPLPDGLQVVAINDHGVGIQFLATLPFASTLIKLDLTDDVGATVTSRGIYLTAVPPQEITQVRAAGVDIGAAGPKVLNFVGPAVTDDGVGGRNIVTGTGALLVADTDPTLSANSDANVATQKATKAYVDNAVTGLLDFKGTTDCSANPNYPAASKGDAYVVSVAGKIGGASGTTVDAGDWYVATADNAGGTEGAVGGSWGHVEHNITGLGTAALLAADTDGSLAANSDSNVATQKATRTYVDNTENRNLGTTTNVGNAYTAGAPPAGGYVPGKLYYAKFNIANTGAATLDGHNVYKNSAALTGGEIPTGAFIGLQWDGAVFNMTGDGGGSSSPLTTKGDLQAHGTVDARFPVGTDCQVIIADSTQALGLKYAQPVEVVIDQIVASGSPAVITFADIPQGFADLYMTSLNRQTGATAPQLVQIKFNGDSTSGNYVSHRVYSDGVSSAAAGSDPASTAAGAACFYSSGSASATHPSAAVRLEIPGYSNTTLEKEFICNGGVTFNTSNGVSSGQIAGGWFSAQGISQIDLTIASGSFLNGSVFTLYGRGTKGTGFSMLRLHGAFWSPAPNGVPYTNALTTSGGNGVISLHGGTGITKGALPGGLGLSIVGSTVLLSGTPTSGAGTFAFTVGIDSGDGQVATSDQVVVITADAYAALMLSHSPYAAYPMNEPSGTTMLDVSGNARHGTIFPNANKQIAAAPIRVGGIRSYRMTAQDVRIAQTPVLAGLITGSNNGFATELIVRTTTTTGTGTLNYLLAGNPANNSLLSTHYRNTNNARIRGTWSSGTGVAEEPNNGRGSSVHVVHVFPNGATATRVLYVNGKNVGSVSDNHNVLNDFWIMMGDVGGGSSTLGTVGYISDANFYSAPLSATDILALAKAAGFVSNFDPTAKSGNIDTSGLTFNQKAQMANVAAIGAVLSRNGFAGGASEKRIFEITNGGGDATHAWRWGFATSDQGLTSHIGASATASLGINAVAATQTSANTGGVFTDTAFASSSPGGIGTAGTVQVFVKFATGKVWISNAAGTGWIGGGNPDADTNPTFTFTGSQTYYVGASMDGTNGSTSATFNGAGPFTLNPGGATTGTAWDA